MIVYNINTNGPSSQLVIELINDTVYVEPNSVAYVSGHVVLNAHCNNFSDRLLAFFIGKHYFKPSFKGTGKIYIHATNGTYHKFNIKEDSKLIIDNQAFIACRDTITLRPHISLSIIKFLSGTPMVNNSVQGNGNLVVRMPGPVQEIKLNDDKFVAYDSDIAAYSDELRLTREPAGSGWLKIAYKMVKVYRGTGSVYFTPHPNKDAKVDK